MKRPNLAWRNHCIFSSCDLGAGNGLAPGCATAAPAQSSTRQMFNDKIWRIPRFIDSLLGELPFPHKTVRNSSEGVAPDGCAASGAAAGAASACLRFSPPFWRLEREKSAAMLSLMGDARY